MAERNTQISPNSKLISYNEVAEKLLKDRLILTALELHTELIESGREVKQLKDFFSNPGNFELQSQEISSKISRCGSQTTLDSLDFTRFSEDGERGFDERIAVLEFELRKAKETITALRNNLTVATESEQNSPDKSSTIKSLHADSIKPHEQRALNFLINEYLLLHGYKLTSITFADENENQDFEDWDDVGLNVSKPSELIAIYREGLKQTGFNLKNAFCQTDHYIIHDENLIQRIKSLESEIDVLKVEELNQQLQIKNLQEENEKLLKQYDNSSQIIKNVGSCKNSTIGSNSPEYFEMIEKNNLDDNVSISSTNAGDWTKLNLGKDQEEETKNIEKYDDIKQINNDNIKSKLPKLFTDETIKLCQGVNISDGSVLNDVHQPATPENFIQLVSNSLLRIIPNIILNKREEAIPMLISAVQLNADPTIRDKLLQQLFNLKKKPSEAERILIRSGIYTIAQYSKESVVENEILPQCWEQLGHKHPERRLLVAESCRVLIPFVSPTIRNSLMLSMLQQMLDDREESVREEVIKALAYLVINCDDIDKYNQYEELGFSTLKDSSNLVVYTSIQIFFPVISNWALKIDKLCSSMIRNLLHKLNDTLKVLKNESPSKTSLATDVIVRIINVLNHLLPFILVYIADNKVIVDRIEKDMRIDLRSEFQNICTQLTSPKIFYNGDYDVGMILHEFDRYIEENIEYKLKDLDWFTDIVIPDLLNSLNLVEITQHELLQAFIDLFSNICITFGKAFSKKVIQPLFLSQVQNLEQILSSFNQYTPSLNIIPVYLVAVLSYCDIQATTEVLKKFLCALPLCGTPLDCLEITVKGLCNINLQENVVASLWEGVVHQRPLVRAVMAGLFASVIGLCDEVLLSTKVAPALVTLANDSDILVRTATVPALGAIITDCSLLELHDKSYMQLQTFLADPTIKENHSLLRQLVVTMGNIVICSKPSFRQDVILPQLSSLSVYMSQMSSATRKVDMAVALIEAYCNIIFSSINNISTSNTIMPGLRLLEQVVNENTTLLSNKETLVSMIKECEAHIEVTSPQTPTDKASKISQNVNQGVEEMKQRVSKIFNKPPSVRQPSLPNLQALFKKK